MAAIETTVYPVKGRYLVGIPRTVHTVATRAEAEELAATGAFTIDEKSDDRDDEAPDETQLEEETPRAKRK